MPTFSIPTSLHDLEREPYNLLPYPVDFNDEDDEARIRSFDSLVRQLKEGNEFLSIQDISIFEAEDTDEGSWLDCGRLQALYTLVRKSSSLLPLTRQALAKVLSDALQELSAILEQKFLIDKGETVPQTFRDAYACHVYMLYSFMFLYESDAKGKDRNTNEIVVVRQISTDAMLRSAETMATYRNTLWRRGVPDEAVVLLPCRIAYPMLELMTGVLARRVCCGDQVLKMVSVTVNSNEFVLNSVTTAVMDLMHSFEHMAGIAAELCTMIQENPLNRLAVELLREFGRVDSCDTKATVGVKNVAPFVSELALLRPRILLSNISHIFPLLNAEQYSLRSSIVTAIGHVAEFLLMRNDSINTIGEEATNDAEQCTSPGQVYKSVNSLLQVLAERCYDTSSYTRAAAVKAWIRLSESSCIPRERTIEVTKLAMGRVQDKTVVVRKPAMQVIFLKMDVCFRLPFVYSLFLLC
jgi:condensin complex subunit 1